MYVNRYVVAMIITICLMEILLLLSYFLMATNKDRVPFWCHIFCTDLFCINLYLSECQLLDFTFYFIIPL